MLSSDRYKVIGDTLCRNSKGLWLPIVSGKLPNGYEQYHLMIKRDKVSVYRHILVYLSNYGVYPEGYEIDHKDRDKTNNKPYNLRAVPVCINAANKDKKINTAKVRTIRGKEIEKINALRLEGLSQSAIARELNLNRLSVRYTIKRLEEGSKMKYKLPLKDLP